MRHRREEGRLEPVGRFCVLLGEGQFGGALGYAALQAGVEFSDGLLGLSAFRHVARDHDHLRHLAVTVPNHASLRLNMVWFPVNVDKAVFQAVSYTRANGIPKCLAHARRVFWMDLLEGERASQLSRVAQNPCVGRTAVDASAIEIDHGHQIRQVFHYEAELLFTAA